MHIVVLNAAAPPPERDLLTCPLCGSQRLVLAHLDCRALGSLQGEVQVGRQGLQLDQDIPAPEGGPTVGVRCTCDQGHDSLIRFRQLRSVIRVERSVLPATAHPASPAAGGGTA